MDGMILDLEHIDPTTMYTWWYWT